MDKFKIGTVSAMMNKRTNIRNISIIGSVHHGKTSLIDCLFSPLIKTNEIGLMSYPDMQDYEENNFSIRSTAISLYSELSLKYLHEITQETEGNEFLVNLIDTPGHVEFFPEVTAALRVTDGAIVVVDCVSGVRLQTEISLRKAITERVKPVLFINMMDRILLDLNFQKEDLYQKLYRIIDCANIIIQTCGEATEMSDIIINPGNENVAFGSALEGWGFTLKQFADIYVEKFGLEPNKIIKRLWGDQFYNYREKRWKKELREGYERGFSMLILDPIYKLINSIINFKREESSRLIQKLHIELNPEDMKFEGKPFLKRCLSRWLPVGQTLLKMITIHLPSPITAQKYRMEILYEGLKDDGLAVGIKNCDPKAPLMMYVSKMVPTADRGRFYTFGRVFSGTLVPGQEVLIKGPNYIPGKKEDLYNHSIHRAVIFRRTFEDGRHKHTIEAIEEVPCGNIILIEGVDQFLVKTGTITTHEGAQVMRPMKFNAYPVMHVSVEPKCPAELPKLIEGIKSLAKSDPMVQCAFDEHGDFTISGCGEVHLESCLKALEKKHTCIPFKKTNTFVSYRETISQLSSQMCLSKSPNKHNRLFCRAEPLDDGITKDIDSGKVDPFGHSKSRSRYLAEEYEWDLIEARKIWAFGPENSGPNILVDCTMGVQYVDEIKNSAQVAFQWVTKEGVLCEENCRGIRMNIHDVTIQSDTIHRGGGQIIPTARRVFYASILTAKPRLLEPVYLCEIHCPEDLGAAYIPPYGGICGVLNNRRGYLFEESHVKGNPMFYCKAYLPASESFEFKTAIMNNTDGQAFTQCVFDHWQLLTGDPMEVGFSNKAAAVVTNTRKRKGLAERIPPLDRFLDKL